MKVKFEKRKKTSKLIALWVVFVMLITPFMGAAGPEKGAKAEDPVTPQVTEIKADPNGTESSSAVVYPKANDTAVISKTYDADYQTAKIVFGSVTPTYNIGYKQDGSGYSTVIPAFKYVYCEYSDTEPVNEYDTLPSEFTFTEINGGGELPIDSTKKIAVYATITNFGEVQYSDESGSTSTSYTGSKYVRIARISVTYVDVDAAFANLKLKNNTDEWATDNKICTTVNKTEIINKDTNLYGSDFALKYFFISSEKSPADIANWDYTSDEIQTEGNYDAYVAYLDTQDVNKKLIKSVKIGSVTMVDGSKKVIELSPSDSAWGDGNDLIDKEQKTVNLSSTTYEEVKAVKLTYKKNSDTVDTDYQGTVCSSLSTTQGEDGYFHNSYSIVLPEDADSNIKLSDIKLTLYSDVDAQTEMVSKALDTFLYDKTAPVIASWDAGNTIIAGDAEWKKGDSADVKFTVNSGNGTVESDLVTYKYSISNSVSNVTGQTVSLINATSKEHTITIPKSTTSAGTKLTLDIADAAGNTIETTDYYFKLDGTAPGTIKFDVAGQVVNDGGTIYGNKSATVSVSAVDNESGLGKIEYYVGDTLKQTVNSYADQTGVTLESILGSDCVDGSYTIKAKVYDNAGNSSEASFTVNYDNTSPTYTAVLGSAPSDETGWNSWAPVDASEISEGIYIINTATSDKKYAYKLVVTETNLASKVNDSFDTFENQNNIVKAPAAFDIYTANTYYLEIDSNNLSYAAAAPSLIIKDLAGNKSSDTAVQFDTKVQAINHQIVPTEKVFLNDVEITDTTNLVNGTNARYKAQITLECPTQFKEIKAVSKVDGAATDTELVILSDTAAEGTFDNVKKVYVKTFDITLLADDATDVTKLFKDIVVTVKTIAYTGDADNTNRTRYITFGLDNVLFDRTNPTVAEMTAKDSSNEDVEEQTWVTNATFTAKVNSGNAAANESDLSEAKYTIEGTATTAGGDFTIANINGVINTPVTIPESSTTAGTKVTFVVRDIAGNYLNGSSAGKTYIYFVDATEPSVENISARENQINELLAGAPVITADLKDNLTIDRVEVTTVGTASKTTTVTYGANVDEGTKEFRKSLTSLVADADKGGAGVKDGNYTVTLKVYDKAGNSNTDTVTFTVDNTIPVVNAEISAGTINSYRSPKNISYYNGNVTVDLAYTENSIDTVTVKDNGTVVTPNWNGSKATYTATSEGRHKITIVAKDKAGHISKEKSVTFTIDKTRPDVSSSVNGAVDPGRLLELMVNANVQAYITDASSTELYYQTTYTKPYDEPVVKPYSLAGASTLTFTDEGEYTVSFYAVDAANNRSDTKTVSFRIDKTTPVVSISGAGDGTSATGRTVSFSIEEAFWKDAKATVNVYRKPGDGLRETLVKTIEITPTARVTTQSESFAESGEYRFEIEARDSIGHTAKQEGTLRIDVDKPTLSVSGVDRYDVTDDKVTFYAEINDNFYSSKVVKFVGNRKDIDGKDNKIDVTINNPKSSPTTISEEFTEDGIYDITLTVTDEAGNSVEKELHFTIDRTAPEIESFDWLNGKVLQKFEWDKDLDEIVRDLTVCETHMYLNGSEYDGSSDLEDGSYTLRITAVDEVGHETELDNISFTIDSTKPTFIVTGVEDGDIKEETYSITVSLQLDEDTLKEVTLNGDAVEIKDNQATLSVSSKGDYELYMRAVDEAGNESEQTISFTYGKEGLPWLLILGVSGGVLLTGLVIFILLKLKKR